MRLVHDKHGETYAETKRELNRLRQYGWRLAEQPQPEPVAPTWEDVLEPVESNTEDE